MLEAMQEHRVTVAGRAYHLDAPFFVQEILVDILL